MLVVRADGFVDPCIPSRAPKPPSGPDWVHEIKHDGYRLIVRRDGETVQLFTRRGHRHCGGQGPVVHPGRRGRDLR
jgi:ATP-dependent DNA ligase